MKKQIIPVSPIQIGNTPGGSLAIRIKNTISQCYRFCCSIPLCYPITPTAVYATKLREDSNESVDFIFIFLLQGEPGKPGVDGKDGAPVGYLIVLKCNITEKKEEKTMKFSFENIENPY